MGNIFLLRNHMDGSNHQRKEHQHDRNITLAKLLIETASSIKSNYNVTDSRTCYTVSLACDKIQQAKKNRPSTQIEKALT